MAGAKWFGYGEDALTYWALRTRLDYILDKLGDKSSEGDTIVFYRPSFGRGGQSQAPFGEFDAIVATPQSIYPVEAKWSESSEVQDRTINVTEGQIKRHKIFAWYLERYAACKAQSWDRFVTLHGPDFCKTFPDKKLAPPGSKLAANIEFVLRRLSSKITTTTDVLLYLHPKNCLPASSVNPASFHLVNVAFDPKSKGGIFSL